MASVFALTINSYGFIARIITDTKVTTDLEEGFGGTLSGTKNKYFYNFS